MSKVEPVSEERVPAQIGRYEVVCKLGTGGMADVYLAHQPGPFSAGKLVVVKRLKPGVVGDEQFIQMFANESRIAVRLNHPNVIHTYEVAIDGDDYYLALEFLDGRNLGQLQRRCRPEGLPLELQLWVLGQVLSGLHYAHELTDFDGSPLGIVHRDVSPANVFICYTGEVKLLDFGIAKSLAASTATRAGIIKGKLGYASPEQCSGRPIDRRTDIYAVGVMLWEAIAGRKRAVGETDAATYQARILGKEPRIQDVCPETPSQLVDLCTRALAQRPADRFSTALEFRHAIDHYLVCCDSAVDQDDLAKFIQESFERDIAEMQQRIETYMGQLTRPPSARIASGPAPSPAILAVSQRPGDTGVRRSFELSSANASAEQHDYFGASDAPAGLAPPPSASSAGVPPFQRQTPWYMFFAAIAAVGIASYGVAALVTVARTRKAETAAASTASTPVTKAPSSVVPASAPPSVPKQITISLSALPSEAVILLDGRRVSNPYRAIHGADATPHHLNVSARGHQAIDEELVYTGDITASYELESMTQTGKARRRVTTSRATAAAAASRATVAVAAPVASADVRASRAPSAPQPGEDMGSSRPRPAPDNIDEMDPYRK